MNTSISKTANQFLADIPPAKKTELEKTFMPLFTAVDKWSKEAAEIKVTDESQTDIMREARTTRLELKKIRTTAESRRKELKSNYLRMGKAIDGFANIIKAAIVPLEDHLLQQEMYIEIKEAERVEEIRNIRIKRLQRVDAPIHHYNSIEKLSDAEFETLMEMLTRTYEDKKAAEKAAQDAEKKRLKEAEAEAEKARLALNRWKSRMLQMPLAFVKEGDVFYEEKKIATEDEITNCNEVQFKAILMQYMKIRKEKLTFEAQQEERTNQLQKLKLVYDKDKNAFVGKDIFVSIAEKAVLPDADWANLIARVSKVVARNEAEQKKLEAIKAEQDKKAAEQERLASASDKEKLIAFKQQLIIQPPVLKSAKARAVLDEAVKTINKAMNLIEHYTGK